MYVLHRGIRYCESADQIEFACRSPSSQNRKSTTRRLYHTHTHTHTPTTAKNKIPDTFYLVSANGTIGALTLRFLPPNERGPKKEAHRRGWFALETPHRAVDRLEDLAHLKSAANWIVFRSTPTFSSVILSLRERTNENSITPRKIFTSRFDPSI